MQILEGEELQITPPPTGWLFNLSAKMGLPMDNKTKTKQKSSSLNFMKWEQSN